MNVEEIEKNLIQDFTDYLEENNLEISVNWITNECYINNYLMSIFYDIQDNTETQEECEEIQDKFYKILDDYCCSNAIPLF